MKKKSVKELLLQLNGEEANLAEIKNCIISNFTVSAIVDELIDLYNSSKSPVVNDVRKPITLNQEDYDKLLELIKPKQKRERRAAVVAK